MNKKPAFTRKIAPKKVPHVVDEVGQPEIAADSHHVSTVLSTLVDLIPAGYMGVQTPISIFAGLNNSGCRPAMGPGPSPIGVLACLVPDINSLEFHPGGGGKFFWEVKLILRDSVIAVHNMDWFDEAVASVRKLRDVWKIALKDFPNTHL